MLTLKFRLRFFALTLLFLSLLPGVGMAATKDISSSVTQSFNSSGDVRPGMAVRLKDKSNDTVVPLEKSRAKDLLGVVLSPGSTAVVLSAQKPKGTQVVVARKGLYPMLVSGQNGPIKSGDLIMVSDVPGIGMKSDGDSATAIVGKARQSFDGQTGNAGSLSLKAADGSTVTLAATRLDVDLDVPFSPVYAQNTAYVPDFLSRMAAGIAGKQVSAVRIYLGLAVVGVAAFLSGSLLSGGVRGGMVAIGRNPLSKRSIFRGIAETSAIGLGIFVIGLVAVYLLLKL